MQVCNDWRLGRCNRSQCRFSHEEPSGGSGTNRPAPYARAASVVEPGHPSGLPNRLLDLLFRPRPSPAYLRPMEKKKQKEITGISSYVDLFAEPEDPEYAPERVSCENHLDARKRKKKEKLTRHEKELEEKISKYDPFEEKGFTEDPYKTLMISSLPLDVKEDKLIQVFSEFGPIRTVKIIRNVVTGKPRGYAFLEYEHKRDAKSAYKLTGSLRIEGKKVMVDVERGRTVSGWRPRRLGGGLGGETRKEKPNKWKRRLDALSKANSPTRRPPSPRFDTDRRRRDVERSPLRSFRDHGREFHGRDRYESERERSFRDRERDRDSFRSREHERHGRRRTRSRSRSLEGSWKRHRSSYRSRSRTPPRERSFSPHERLPRLQERKAPSPSHSPEEGEIV